MCAPELTQALHGGSSELMLCDTPGFHFGQEHKAKDWFPDIIFRGAVTGGVGNGFYYLMGSGDLGITHLICKEYNLHVQI
mgnify:CR=1 FL=1